MDFKIGDEIEDESTEQQNKQKKSKLPIIIVIIISILCGLIVFLISNALFGKKEIKPKPLVDTPLSLKEENVEILYQYVTYGTRNQRNDKFVRESKVTIDSFSNNEKFYYALQFAQMEDFVETGRVDENNHPIYSISASRIKDYMKRFFGSNVTYSTGSIITYPFSFKIDGQNVATMKLSNTGDEFDVVFNGVENAIKNEDVVEPYYTELSKATKKADGSYELEEKVIYTKIEKDGERYIIYIYKDYERTMLIETKPNQTKEMLEENPIDIDDYEEKASTITYKFKVDGTMLYFDSSSIAN